MGLWVVFYGAKNASEGLIYTNGVIRKKTCTKQTTEQLLLISMMVARIRFLCYLDA